MLIALLIEQFLLLRLLLLRVVHILLYLLTMSAFIVEDFLSLLFFLSFMKESYLGFLVDSHLLAESLFIVMFHISASLVNDIASFLASLLNFFECARLLCFQQLNSIC